MLDNNGILSIMMLKEDQEEYWAASKFFFLFEKVRFIITESTISQNMKLIISFAAFGTNNCLNSLWHCHVFILSGSVMKDRYLPIQFDSVTIFAKKNCHWVCFLFYGSTKTQVSRKLVVIELWWPEGWQWVSKALHYEKSSSGWYTCLISAQYWLSCHGEV